MHHESLNHENHESLAYWHKLDTMRIRVRFSPLEEFHNGKILGACYLKREVDFSFKPYYSCLTFCGQVGLINRGVYVVAKEYVCLEGGHLNINT